MSHQAIARFAFAGFMAAIVLTQAVTTARAHLGSPRQQRDTASSRERQEDAASAQLSDATAVEVQQLVMIFKQAVLDEKPVIRAAAVRAMGQLIAFDDSLIDIVDERARNDEPVVKLAAMDALCQLESPPDAAIDTMLVLFCDADITGQDRPRVLEAILKRGGGDRVVPRAIAVLTSGNEAEQLGMIELLARYERGAMDAMSPLMRLASQETGSDEVRAAALRCSAAIMNSVASEEAFARAMERTASLFIAAAFDKYDRDRNGVISEDEMDNSRIKVSVDDGAIDFNRGFAAVDRDSNHLVTRDELLAAAESAFRRWTTARD